MKSNIIDAAAFKRCILQAAASLHFTIPLYSKLKKRSNIEKK
jgi:hypothetical protein